MAKKANKLAYRYAKALLGAIAKEGGGKGGEGLTQAQQDAAALVSFAELWQGNPQFSASMLNPMFEKGERLAALVEIGKKHGLRETILSFLRVCFERDRIGLLPEIAAAFSELADESAGLLRIEVTTARTISRDEAKSIEKSLAQSLKGKLIFKWNVEPEILGGLVVRYSGKIFDGSVQGKLSRVEHKLRTQV